MKENAWKSKCFKPPIDVIWEETERYWHRDPSRLSEQNETLHKMAPIFRWYLGNSSRRTREGNVGRKKDFQIWCGPSLVVSINGCREPI